MAIRMGGAVERCHTIRHQGSYAVNAHSWGVAVLMYILWPKDFPRLVAYCIFHDVPEAWVGDVPAPAKKFNKTVKQSFDKMETAVFSRLDLPNDLGLSTSDRAKLKACDHLELYLWAQEQVLSGNQHAACVVREIEGFFRRDPLPLEADMLLDEIMDGSVEYDLGEGYRHLFKRS